MRNFWLLILLIVALLFAVFVWPTRWRYDHVSLGEGTRLPVRVDRLTGITWVLSVAGQERGWIRVLDPRNPYARPPVPTEERMNSTDGIQGRGWIDEMLGEAYSWKASLYNATDWTLTEITVSLKFKGLTRLYRIECYIKPQSSGDCSTTVDEGVKLIWKKTRKNPEWGIVSARGYRSQE